MQDGVACSDGAAVSLGTLAKPALAATGTLGDLALRHARERQAEGLGSKTTSDASLRMCRDVRRKGAAAAINAVWKPSLK